MTITPLTLAFIVLGLAVLAGVIIMLTRRRHSQMLRSKFGPEYDQTVRRVGNPHKAEHVLEEREKRVSKFNIIPLSESRRAEYVTRWREIQAQFVDDPAGALTRADVLIAEVMNERGYPVTDFEQRSADLSVDHPEVVQNYRAGHDIAVRHARGECGTEELRQAMIHYRALFDDLANEPAPAASAPKAAPSRKERVRD